MSVAAHHDDEKDIDSLNEAANVPSHIEKRVDDSFILVHAIVQPELRLKISRRIDRTKRLLRCVVNR